MTTSEVKAVPALRAQLENAVGICAIGIEVQWNGNVVAIYPDKARGFNHQGGYGYVTTKLIGVIDSVTLSIFKPLFASQKGMYPGETLHDGGVQFQMKEGGMLPTRQPRGRVTRPGGGCSYQELDIDKVLRVLAETRPLSLEK